jgi:hypothetical protein
MVAREGGVVDVQDQLDVLRAEVDELQHIVAELIHAITRDATPARALPETMAPFVNWHDAERRRKKAESYKHPEFGNPRMKEWIEWGRQSWARRSSDDESRTDR